MRTSSSVDFNSLDELWRVRHEGVRLVALERQLDAAVRTKPEYGVLWRGARLAHFQGLMAKDDKTALAHFDLGRSLAQRAVEDNHHDVEGHYWWGINLLEASRRSGFLHGPGQLRSAQTHIERAMNQDETYYFAGPVRAIARITHVKPLILGGSIDRALDMHGRALQIAPHNSTGLLHYAETLMADQQKALARQILHQIINAPADPEWIAEQALDRQTAQTRIAELDASH